MSDQHNFEVTDISYTVSIGTLLYTVDAKITFTHCS